jgi:hypothetical protein
MYCFSPWPVYWYKFRKNKIVHFIYYSPNNKLCHCNRTKNEHPNTDDQFQSNEKWQRNNHTIKDPTKEQGVSPVNGAPVRER